MEPPDDSLSWDIKIIPSNPLFTFGLLILLDAAAGDPDVVLVVREGLGDPDGPVPTRGADPTPARLVRFILNHRQTKHYDITRSSRIIQENLVKIYKNYHILCVGIIQGCKLNL